MTCNGACCEGFPLLLSKEMLMRRYQNSEDANGTLLEMKMVAEMVIPIQNEAVVHNGKRYFWFTCKNFDKQTRRCRIYEKRPSLCRSYPDKYGEEPIKCSSMLHNGCEMSCGTEINKARLDFKIANGLIEECKS
jgi:Fe-S-cluster containining protein